MKSEHYSFYLIVFVVSVIVSAFFSGSETALLSLSKHRISQTSIKSPKKLELIKRLQGRVQEIVIALLVGNTIANLSAATVAALFAKSIAHTYGFNEWLTLTSEVVIVTLVLLMFSELLPKIVAVRRPLGFLSIVASTIYFYINMIRPITFLLDSFTTFVTTRIGVSSKGILFEKEELLTLVEVGEEKGTLEKEESEMISSIFEFRDTQVKEVMVPRIDIVAIEKSSNISELIDLIKQRGHTRIPIFDHSIDKILGILHAKDLLPYLNREDEPIDISQLARPVIFVPEYKMIDDLLREFQREQLHMAIVVDEYGGTSGLVTLEDILEEIVGEIQDEYDRETPLFRKVGESAYVVNAKIDLHDLNRELDVDLPTESDFESLGGFIFHLTGAVPKKNQVIEYQNFKFIIEGVDRNRIGQVRIEIQNIENDPVESD